MKTKSQLEERKNLTEWLPIFPGSPDDVDDRITANQKSFLHLLASRIQNDQIRNDLLKRINLLSRYKASKIIETLLNGDDEEITRFF